MPHETLSTLLGFLASLAWPAIAFMVILMFRIELRNLFARLKSGEIPGAKFTFNEAAAGYIRERVGDLAEEDDPSERAELAREITGVATLLDSIHPISLSIMISSLTGTGWSDFGFKGEESYFSEYEKYFRSLEKAGLVEIRRVQIGTAISGKSVHLFFTEQGARLMQSLGFSEDVITETNARANKYTNESR